MSSELIVNPVSLEFSELLLQQQLLLRPVKRVRLVFEVLVNRERTGVSPNN